jgi:predicted O-methyltransferase YrrM
MLIKGAMNAEAFLAYIEQCLAATLRRGDIIVADNVSFHKPARRGGINRGPRGRPAILAAVFAGPQSNRISVPSPEDTAAKGG